MRFCSATHFNELVHRLCSDGKVGPTKTFKAKEVMGVELSKGVAQLVGGPCRRGTVTLATKQRRPATQTGLFERLYLSRVRWYPEEQRALWRGLVENPHLPVVLPLPHLLPELDLLRYLAAKLHLDAAVSGAYLLSGPQGIGKTYIFQTFADHAHAAQAAVSSDGDKLAICCYFDLAAHTASDCDQFDIRLLGMIVGHLRRAKQRLGLAQTLSELAGAAPDRVEEFAPKVTRGPFALLTSTQTKVSVASALLKMSGVGVIVFVDEAECVFQDGYFSAACAATWLNGFDAVSRIRNSAIGMVLCTRFSRTHLLFNSGSRRDAFPPEYTHAHMRRNWGDQLTHLRLQSCRWTRESLMAYILSHVGSASGPPFDLYTRDAAWRPDPGNLKTARALDKLSQFCPEGTDDGSPHGLLEAFLEHVLKVCGHSPRRVQELTQELAGPGLSSLTSWPAPEVCEEQRIVQASCPTKLRVISAFLSVLDPEMSVWLRSDSLLTFVPATVVVRRQKLVQSLVPSDDVLHADANKTGRSVLAVEASAHEEANAWIGDAIDAGWLEDLGTNIALRSLLIYRYCESCRAHPRAADEMDHPGSAIETELPVTPESASSDIEHHVQLAGMRGADGDGLAKHGGLLAAACEAQGTLSRRPTRGRALRARKAGRAAASLGRAKRRRSSVAHKPRAKRKARM